MCAVPHLPLQGSGPDCVCEYERARLRGYNVSTGPARSRTVNLSGLRFTPRFSVKQWSRTGGPSVWTGGTHTGVFWSSHGRLSLDNSCARIPRTLSGSASDAGQRAFISNLFGWAGREHLGGTTPGDHGLGRWKGLCSGEYWSGECWSGRTGEAGRGGELGLLELGSGSFGCIARATGTPSNWGDLRSAWGACRYDGKRNNSKSVGLRRLLAQSTNGTGPTG